MGRTHAAFARWRFELRGCYDAAVQPAHRSLATWDDLLTAWLVRRGSVEVRHAGGRVAGGAGDWMLLPPGLRRRHRFSDDARILSLRCLALDAAGRPAGLGAAPRAGRWPELAAAAMPLCDAVAAALPPGERWEHRPLRALPLARLARLHAALVGWASAALTRLGVPDDDPPPEPRVAAAAAVLAATAAPSALPWRELRRATGLSRAQLDRLFRVHEGRSARAWRDDRLLAEACHALEDPAIAVRAVAARFAFADASHFCRWFRQRTGLPPARWRATHAV